ncbi:MAG: SPOR domain-containing protein [Spirochaetales bacterium]|nr:MAG: SPOR domain-containing protein [Spirochaetales bacterium]
MRSGTAQTLIVVLCLLPMTAPAAQETSGATIVQSLAPRSAEPGFADLVLAASRSAVTIDDAITILVTLAPKVPQAVRKPLLVDLANLYELAERWADAAEVWQEAAATPAGSRDAVSLLSAAASWLAAGRPENAGVPARTALSLSSDQGLVDRATLLLGWSLLDSGDAGAALEVARSLVDSGRPQCRPGALILATRASEGAEHDRLMGLLEKEFPGQASSALFARYGMAYLQSATPEWKPADVGGAGSAPKQASDRPAVDAAVSAGSVQNGPLWYQVGAFRERENAERQVKAMAGKGFSATVVEKSGSAGPVFAVYVAVGPDAGATLLALKDAGFEAWPVFDRP